MLRTSRFFGQTLVGAFCAMFLFTAGVMADPASQPAETQLVGSVTGVQGYVEIQTSADQHWKKCVVGMMVDQGTSFRTGLASAVQFQIPPDQTVTLDRLGTVTLLQAIQANGKVTTDLGMKYGRTRYEIEAAGIQHVSTIHSPNATMAVRGTTISFTDQRPFPVEAVSLTGTATYSTAKREMAVGGHGTGTATAVGDLPPAQAALIASVVDPSSKFARTPSEQQLVATVLSHGGVITESKPGGIPIVSGGTPPTDAEILATNSDPLTFILRWTGNSNLDLYITAPQDALGAHNALVYPASGLNYSPNGGHIPFNNIGGPNGGYEIATFPGPIIPGKYGLGVNFVSGDPTSLTADAYLNGQPVKLFTGDIFNYVTQLNDTVGPRPQYVNTTGAVALVGINSIISGPSGFARIKATVVRPTAKTR